MSSHQTTHSFINRLFHLSLQENQLTATLLFCAILIPWCRVGEPLFMSAYMLKEYTSFQATYTNSVVTISLNHKTKEKPTRRSCYTRTVKKIIKRIFLPFKLLINGWMCIVFVFIKLILWKLFYCRDRKFVFFIFFLFPKMWKLFIFLITFHRHRQPPHRIRGLLSPHIQPNFYSKMNN